MVLTLKRNDLLRLRRAAGSAIEVLSGRVWLTEHGRAGDRLLGPGRRYRVWGDGLVLVGTETCAGEGPGAEIAVRSAGERSPAGRLGYLGVKRLLGWIA